MKFLSMIFLSLSLVNTSFIFSEQLERKCECKDCKCSHSSHCGCYSDQGCACTAEHSCCPNCDRF